MFTRRFAFVFILMIMLSPACLRAAEGGLPGGEGRSDARMADEMVSRDLSNRGPIYRSLAEYWAENYPGKTIREVRGRYDMENHSPLSSYLGPVSREIDVFEGIQVFLYPVDVIDTMFYISGAGDSEFHAKQAALVMVRGEEGFRLSAIVPDANPGKDALLEALSSDPLLGNIVLSQNKLGGGAEQVNVGEVMGFAEDHEMLGFYMYDGRASVYCSAPPRDRNDPLWDSDIFMRSAYGDELYVALLDMTGRTMLYRERLSAFNFVNRHGDRNFIDAEMAGMLNRASGLGLDYIDQLGLDSVYKFYFYIDSGGDYFVCEPERFSSDYAFALYDLNSGEFTNISAPGNIIPETYWGGKIYSVNESPESGDAARGIYSTDISGLDSIETELLVSFEAEFEDHVSQAAVSADAAKYALMFINGDNRDIVRIEEYDMNSGQLLASYDLNIVSNRSDELKLSYNGDGNPMLYGGRKAMFDEYVFIMDIMDIMDIEGEV